MIIPQKLHQIWIGSDIIREPYFSASLACQKIHKHWDYKRWTEADILLLIDTHYPKYKALYLSYPHLVQRIDLAKVFIMHKFGGVYMDMDMECLKPLDTLLLENSKHGIIFSILRVNCLDNEKFCPIVALSTGFLYKDQPYLSCGFFAAVPNHPFFLDLLREYEKKNVKKKWYHPKTVYVSITTGNTIVTDVVRKRWLNKSTILDSKYLEPCNTKFDCTITDSSYAKDHLANHWMPSSELAFIYMYTYKGYFILAFILVILFLYYYVFQ